jgi:protein-tyrosine phosphatase
MSELERLVPLAGTYNLRDVGGYRAAGGTTRWGKLYRSDSLHALTDADVAELARRGVKRVIDLRSDDEADFSPSRLDALDAEIIRNPLLSGPTSDYIARDAALAELYSDIVEREGDRLIAAIRHIAGSGDDPVIVHCTAGKDRTGVTVATLGPWR